MGNEFEKIIEEAIAKAEKVDCDIEEFRKGLNDMVNLLIARCDFEY